MTALESAAAACLIAFAAVALVDGIVLHLWRERLHQRPGARFEHALHSVRAVLFPIILVSLFAGATSLAVALIIVAVDQVVEIWDMAVERQSRSFSGGLRSFEYVVHGGAITLRAAAIALLLAARSLGPTPATAAGWWTLPNLVDLLLPGAILAAVVHVTLLVMPRPFGRARAGLHA